MSKALLLPWAAALLLCYTLGPATGQEDEVALIIGGYWAPDRETLEHVELFGCPGAGSIRMEDYPTNTYLSGAAYLEDEGKVLSCGGFSCVADGDGGVSECDRSEECHYFSLDTGSWDEEGAPLLEARHNFLMARVANLNASSDDPAPLVIGNDRSEGMTQIYDPEGDEWVQYLDFQDDGLTGLSCFFQRGDLIYSIRETVQVLDTATWKVETLAEVPNSLVNPRRCAYTEVDGTPGIFTRYGYWFDLEGLEWNKKAFPVFEPVAQVPNAMFAFQGRPTIFGTSECDALGTCINEDIIQYNVEKDSWSKIGEMLEPRIYQEIVMLPADACDDFQTSTTEGFFTTTADGDGDSGDAGNTLGAAAALIVGGQADRVLPNTAMQSVELFGCPQADYGSVAVADYPLGISESDSYLMAADSLVMTCGGVGCDEDGACSERDECFTWDPEKDQWKEGPALREARNLFIIAEAPNLEDGKDNTLFPLAIGSTETTEILSADGDEWLEYKDLDYNNWFSTNCFFQYDGLIYSLQRNIFELNPYTWEVRELGTMPVPLDRRGRCAPVEINGEPGVLLNIGHWFGLRSLSWTKLAVPPVDPLGTFPTSIFSFGGRPTLFGTPVCDDDGECKYKGVMQYNPSSNDWTSLGSMAGSRWFPDVVEVPLEFCDLLLGPVSEEDTSTEAGDSTKSTPDGSTGTDTTSKGTTLTVINPPLIIVLILLMIGSP